MDVERAELYWKWGVRGGLALLLVLSNLLLLLVLINAASIFDSMTKVGSAADRLERAAATVDVLAAELVEDASRVTNTIERVGQDVGLARETLEQAGEDITRATDALEDAQLDLERAANDFGRIADTLEEAFAQ